MIIQLKMAEDKLLEVIARLEGVEAYAQDKGDQYTLERIMFMVSKLRGIRGCGDDGLIGLIKFLESIG